MHRYLNFSKGWVFAYLLLALTFISFQAKAQGDGLSNARPFTYASFDSGDSSLAPVNQKIPIEFLSSQESAKQLSPSRGQPLPVKNFLASCGLLLSLAFYLYYAIGRRKNDGNGGRRLSVA